MKLNFIKTNPTENMTVFILDQVSRDEYIRIAKAVMNYNNLNAEQVGFIEKATNENGLASIRLHMMGGEFCGNASRALAAVLVHRKIYEYCNSRGKICVPIEVSGTDSIIECEVITTNEEGDFISGVKMPLHEKVYDHEVEYNNATYKGTMVEFKGIAHFVVDGCGLESKEAFFQKTKQSYKNKKYDAFGIMFYDEKGYYINPLVYVKGTDSLIWERGCGSGATALGIAISYKQKKAIDIIVNQPGGKLKVTTKWDGINVIGLFLTGDVKIVAEGILYI